MKRHELEHIIRAAAATANVRDIIVVGSQAILGSSPDAPSELTKSQEADVFPKDAPALSIVIDGAIGELSMFNDTFGYYAHGVDESTAILPNGWKDRLVKVQQPGSDAIGWCLEPNDLAVSKFAAGRSKDFAFVEVMLREHLASVETIRERIAKTPLFPAHMKPIVEARLNALKRS